MPLHVDIKLNDRKLTTIHIGRLDDLLEDDQVSRYVATERADEYGIPDWYGPGSVQFSHKYDEGAMVCVRKAIDALLA